MLLRKSQVNVPKRRGLDGSATDALVGSPMLVTPPPFGDEVEPIVQKQLMAPRASAIENLAEKARSIPVSAIHQLNSWATDMLGGTDPYAEDAAEAALHSIGETVEAWHRDCVGSTASPAASPTADDPYIEVLQRQLVDARDALGVWLQFARVLKKSSLVVPEVRLPDGKTYVLSPEALALTQFLAEAAREGYGVRDKMVFRFVDGMAEQVDLIRTLLLNVARHKSQHVYYYLLMHQGAVESLVAGLALGTHAELPFVSLDASVMLYDDCMVRYSPRGLNMDAVAPLDPAHPVTPRARIRSPVGNSGPEAVAKVSRLFPGLPPEVMLRCMGFLLQPRFILPLGDQWRCIFVATGGWDRAAQAFVLHPLEWLVRMFVGLAMTPQFVQPAGATAQACDPCCLFITCPTGELTKDQQSQIYLADVYGMAVVVRSPFLPMALASDEALRLKTVVVNVETALAQEVYDDALPHVVPTVQAFYNACDMRGVPSPLYDPPSFALRGNLPAAASVTALISEMLQTGYMLKVESGATAEWEAVRTAVDEYQTARGHTGFAKQPVFSSNVIEAVGIVREIHPTLKVLGAVGFVGSEAPSSRGYFKNLRVMSK